jgi:hypothetical protein
MTGAKQRLASEDRATAVLEFAPGAVALHRWDSCSPSVTVANGLTLPNGLGWNPQDTSAIRRYDSAGD